MCLHMVAVKSCAARVRLLKNLRLVGLEVCVLKFNEKPDFKRSRFISFFANPIYTGILFFHACHNTQREQRIATDRLTSKAP